MSVNKIGTDEWVSQIEARRRQRHPLIAAVMDAWHKLPHLVQIALLLIVPAIIPLLTTNNYVLQVLAYVWLYAALSVGLNIVVGYTGLLDLGYVAFFGLGGYAYAMLSSPHFGVHLPTLISLPLIAAIGALAGYLLGMPSLRLTGDYLAIVTLGFGQIFYNLTNVMNNVQVPWSSTPLNVTGGPNGIAQVDPIALFGWQASQVRDYYYLLLGTLILVMLVVFNLNRSRLGRAWRAIREDTLAADAMGIPTRRLKLLSFAIGASIAGVCGAIFVASQQSVFPSNFDVALLISLYAMVVLGGVGSLPGMVVGALIITILPEVLRPGQSLAFLNGTELNAVVFYGGVLAFLALVIRPRWQLLALLIVVAVAGIALRAGIHAIDPTLLATEADGSGLNAVIQNWLAIPDGGRIATAWGNMLFFFGVGVLVALTRAPSRFRPVLLGIALYILAFVWETRMSQEPSVTRLLLVGAILVIMMNYRPQGIFGQRRVEVV
jgi:branched-chain amino acid transport system permease protein